MKVLIGESDKIFATILKRQLDKWGFENYWSCDESELAELLPSYEVLLLSRQIGGPDSGLEFCKAARREFPQLYIIMITGSTSLENLVEGIDAGADDYLSKPCNMQELRVRLQVGKRITTLTNQLIDDKAQIDSMLVKLIDTEKKLRATISQNDMILQSIPAFFIAIADTDQIFAWSKKASELFSVSAESAVGCSLSDCKISWNNQDVTKAIRHVRDTLQPEVLNEVEFLKSDGVNGFLQVLVAPVQGVEWKDKPGVIITGYDSSEQVELQQQLEAALKVEAIGNLAAGVAHEINSPLQFIGDNTRFFDRAFKSIGSALLEIKGGLESNSRIDWQALLTSLWASNKLDYFLKELPSTVEYTKEGLEQVTKIVRAMAIYSYSGSESPSVVDVNDVIHAALTLCRKHWKNVMDIEIKAVANLPVVSGYPSEIIQVIINLTINAADAIQEKLGEKKRERGQLTIEVKAQDKEIILLFTDTGNGIPPDVQERIFDRFFTTKSIGKGTGQGLALSKKIIEQRHGGSLTVESSSSDGTCFRVALPLGE